MKKFKNNIALLIGSLSAFALCSIAEGLPQSLVDSTAQTQNMLFLVKLESGIKISCQKSKYISIGIMNMKSNEEGITIDGYELNYQKSIELSENILKTQMKQPPKMKQTLKINMYMTDSEIRQALADSFYCDNVDMYRMEPDTGMYRRIKPGH